MKPATPDFFTTRLEDMARWAEARSLWPLTFGIACCAIEMMATYASSYDLDRMGVLPRSSPRHSDLIIISGTVTFKMAPRIRRLYEQMPGPRYVISMGSCANCGGPYWQYGYHVLKGVDQIIPVDVYIPGCPPRPEALIAGIRLLQDQIEGRAPRHTLAEAMPHSGRPSAEGAPMTGVVPGDLPPGIAIAKPAPVTNRELAPDERPSLTNPGPTPPVA